MDVQLAEQAAERLLLLRRQVLVAEEDDPVVDERVVDLLERALVERLPEVPGVVSATLSSTGILSAGRPKARHVTICVKDNDDGTFVLAEREKAHQRRSDTVELVPQRAAQAQILFRGSSQGRHDTPSGHG